jgi:hypothetical protein
MRPYKLQVVQPLTPMTRSYVTSSARRCKRTWRMNIM